jgi:DhnA family fructose-bisphosphate aldolase class Ia
MIVPRRESFQSSGVHKTMQSSNKQIRLNRIFGMDGRTVIVAMDHGSAGITPLDGLKDPTRLVPVLIDNGADAILTTPGIARLCAHQFGHAGLILRIDGGPSSQTGEWERIQVVLSVEDALRLGADAVIMMGIVGAPGETETLANLWKVAAACHAWGVPLIAEMLPGGFTAKEVSIDQIAVAARLGAELGADLIKIRYQGPAENYRQVIESSYRPVIILGGSKQPLEMLANEARDALKAGAAGVAIGRNVWQDPDPGRITRMLKEAVHTG